MCDKEMNQPHLLCLAAVVFPPLAEHVQLMGLEVYTPLKGMFAVLTLHSQHCCITTFYYIMHMTCMTSTFMLQYDN